jgi:hypothetical protein
MLYQKEKIHWKLGLVRMCRSLEEKHKYLIIIKTDYPKVIDGLVSMNGQIRWTSLEQTK